MSKVKINVGNINRFFEANPLAGVGATGLRGGQTELIAARMISFVKAEIKAQGIRDRTSTLANSLVPIITPDPRGGVRVGVGSTARHSEYLEDGTDLHIITPRRIDRFLRSEEGHPDPLRGPRRYVIHPGNRSYGFIRKGVNAAIGRPLP